MIMQPKAHRKYPAVADELVASSDTAEEHQGTQWIPQEFPPPLLQAPVCPKAGVVEGIDTEFISWAVRISIG
jgi:hypothetical protein